MQVVMETRSGTQKRGVSVSRHTPSASRIAEPANRSTGRNRKRSSDVNTPVSPPKRAMSRTNAAVSAESQQACRSRAETQPEQSLEPSAPASASAHETHVPPGTDLDNPSSSMPAPGNVANDGPIGEQVCFGFTNSDFSRFRECC